MNTWVKKVWAVGGGGGGKKDKGGTFGFGSWQSLADLALFQWSVRDGGLG